MGIERGTTAAAQTFSVVGAKKRAGEFHRSRDPSLPAIPGVALEQMLVVAEQHAAHHVLGFADRRAERNFERLAAHDEAHGAQSPFDPFTIGPPQRFGEYRR